MRWLTLLWLAVNPGHGRVAVHRPIELPTRLERGAPARLEGPARMALEILLEEGRLVPPEALSPDDAIGALDVLTSTLGDPRDATAAFVLGPSTWRAAVDHALARQAHTGSRPEPLSELDPVARQTTLAAWEVFDDLRDRLTLTWPIAQPCRVSSGFGPRWHPILQKPRHHDGVDLAVPIGTPVVAAQTGRVVSTRTTRSSGRTVVIDHGEGLVTAYYHLDELLVAAGAEVERGEPIARSGATGRVTGPHLHFVVSLAGVPIDPALLRPRT